MTWFWAAVMSSNWTRSLQAAAPATMPTRFWEGFVFGIRSRGKMDTVADPLTASPGTEQLAWKALEAHHKKIRRVHLRDLFADDPNRGERLAVQAAGIYLDYSKNRITGETLRL